MYLLIMIFIDPTKPGKFCDSQHSYGMFVSQLQNASESQQDKLVTVKLIL